MSLSLAAQGFSLVTLLLLFNGSPLLATLLLGCFFVSMMGDGGLFLLDWSRLLELYFEFQVSLELILSNFVSCEKVLIIRDIDSLLVQVDVGDDIVFFSRLGCSLGLRNLVTDQGFYCTLQSLKVFREVPESLCFCL
jgi:hypothetical protein